MKVNVKPISQLNQEVLVAGLLPTIWMIGVGIVFGLSFVIMQPKGLAIIQPVIIGLIALAVAVAVHRVSRTRIIKHYIMWNDSGVGGLQGRDLNPVPHRYYETTQEEQEWVTAQRRRDRKRSELVRQEVASIRKQENRLKATKQDKP